MDQVRSARQILVAMCLAALAACGGGGNGDASGRAAESAPSATSTAEAASSPPPEAPAKAGDIAGLWTGGASGRRNVHILTFPNGEVWGFYSEDDSRFAGGFFRSASAVSTTTLQGAATDFNMDGAGITHQELSATVTPRERISGSISGAGRLTFQATYWPDFEHNPALPLLAGTYMGTIAAVGGVNLRTDARVAIDASGALTGSALGGCSITGALKPRTDGNAYDITLALEGGMCAGIGTMTGIVSRDADSEVLRVAATSPAASSGVKVLFFKSR